MDTWGLVPKAQDDAQTIDEAITAAIAAHEADSNAHLGSGESLETHRASEVIDHMAESIVPDKISSDFYSQQIIQSSFQSLDAFDVVAYIRTISLGGVQLITNGSVNNYACMQSISGGVTYMLRDKNPILNFNLKCYSAGTFDAFYGLGGQGPQWDDFFIGFTIENGNYYAHVLNVDDSYESKVAISSFDPEEDHNYTIKVISGDGIYWYIDGVEVSYLAESASFPDYLNIFCCCITSLQNYNTFITCKPFVFQQDL